MASFDFEGHITDIVDYPKPGVVFKDITTLLKDPDGFAATIDAIADHFAEAGVTKVVGAEARGFMIGAPVAYRLHAGFVPARKPGKLPREVRSASYELEYGTAEAQVKLIEQFGAKVAGLGFLMELAFLNPRETIAKVTDAEVFSLVKVN